LRTFICRIVRKGQRDGYGGGPLRSGMNWRWGEQAGRAAACGIALEGETAPEERLLEGLRPREMLLLLDNFEQLIGQRSLDLPGQIVQKCPGCKLPVTSRERLRLLEEEVVDLRGLDVPPAGTTDATSRVKVRPGVGRYFGVRVSVSGPRMGGI